MPDVLGLPEIVAFLYVDSEAHTGLRSCVRTRTHTDLCPGTFQSLNSVSSWEWGGVAESSSYSTFFQHACLWYKFCCVQFYKISAFKEKKERKEICVPETHKTGSAFPMNRPSSGGIERCRLRGRHSPHENREGGAPH